MAQKRKIKKVNRRSEGKEKEVERKSNSMEKNEVEGKYKQSWHTFWPTKFMALQTYKIATCLPNMLLYANFHDYVLTYFI